MNLMITGHVVIRKLIYKWYAYGSEMLFKTEHDYSVQFW